MKSWGIHLHDDEFNCLVKTFDQDGDGEISFGELFDAINEYKREKREGTGTGLPFDQFAMTKRYTPGARGSHVKRIAPRLSRRPVDQAFRTQRTARLRSVSRFSLAPGSMARGRALAGRPQSDLGHYGSMDQSRKKVLPPVCSPHRHGDAWNQNSLH